MNNLWELLFNNKENDISDIDEIIDIPNLSPVYSKLSKKKITQTKENECLSAKILVIQNNNIELKASVFVKNTSKEVVTTSNSPIILNHKELKSQTGLLMDDKLVCDNCGKKWLVRRVLKQSFRLQCSCGFIIERNCDNGME